MSAPMTWNRWTTATLTSTIGLALIALVGVAPAAGQGPTTQVQEGERLFREHGCYGCHRVGKMGTPIAPDLSKVGAKHDAAYLRQWIKDPSSQRPTAHMPQIKMSDAETRALAAFLSSLR